MRTYNDFAYSLKSHIENTIEDSLKEEDIVSVSLKIKASHAGRVNGNDVFYTPRSMKKGAVTLTLPFKKHLQDLHNGAAVGEIREASYKDYLEEYSEDFKEIAERINRASTPQQLVAAVKELVRHEDYSKPGYKGLGVMQVSAELFNEQLIDALVSGSNKGKVSIGGGSTQVYCSICAELFTKKHKHVKGRVYDGDTCFAVYDDMNLDHIGFVPDPADEKTETVIVSNIHDSLEDQDGMVSIEQVKIQDNKQGKHLKMKLEDLKQLLKEDSNYLFSLVEGITDEQLETLKENYTKSLKGLRASSYLLTTDTLLAKKTKEQVALAQLAINLLEEGEEKDSLQEMLKNSLETHFKDGEDPTEFLLSTFEKKGEEGKGTGGEGAQTGSSSLNFEEFLSDEFLTKVATKLVEVLKTEVPESVPVKDSVQFKELIQRNKQLETDIEAIEAQNEEITASYKESLVSQILHGKGLDSEDGYATILRNHNIDTLVALLKDSQYVTVTTASKKEPEKEPDQDPLEQTVIQDSIGGNKNPPKEDTDKGVGTDSLSILRTKGVAQYLKSIKNN